jgi:sugar lactone lactonase YvrE
MDTYVGDAQPENIPALEANLSPRGLALDGHGSLFTTSFTGMIEWIRQIRPDGTIVTVAGSPVRTSVEENGGPAIGSDVFSVWDVAIGPDGRLYFTLGSRCVVRELDATGRVHTVAGRWLDGVSRGDGGPATEAAFEIPQGLLWGPDGTLYVSELRSIRRIEPDGTIHTFAGDGSIVVTGLCEGCLATSTSVYGAMGMVFDSLGRMVIAMGFRIRRIELDGTLWTLAGNGLPGYSGDGGPARSARIGHVQSIAVDAQGGILLGDRSKGVIRRIGPDDVISTIAGTGTKGYSGDGGPASLAQLGEIGDIEVDAVGNIYLADEMAHRIRRIDTNGIITTFAGNGSWSYAGDGGPISQAAFSPPPGVATTPAGEVFLLDSENARLRRVDAQGIVTTFARLPAKTWSLALHPDGGLCYLTGNIRIERVDQAGVVHFVGGTNTPGYGGDGGPVTAASFSSAAALVISDDGSMFIADTYNHRIRRVAPDGIVSTVAGNGIPSGSGPGDGGPAVLAGLYYPTAVWATSAGVLYIAETPGQRVRMVEANGIITTIAGGHGRGFSGDGGPATQAQLSDPDGLFVDSAGRLLIADAGNNRIRCVLPDGTIWTVAGNGDTGYTGGGVPALEATLDYPGLLCAGPDNSVFVLGSWSGRLFQLVPVQGVPVAYGAPSAVVVDGRVVVSWTARGGTAASFQIERRSAGSDESWAPVGVVAADGREEYTFADALVSGAAGRALEYRVVVRGGDGNVVTILGPVTAAATASTWLAGLAVLPNPVTERGVVRFTLPTAGVVDLGVYDLRGRRLAQLARGRFDAGPHETAWAAVDQHGRRVAAGTYIVRMTTPNGMAREAKVSVTR